MKAVILEDEGLMALFLQENLENLGYKVVGCFSDAQSFYKFLEETPPVDLVIMDILINGPIDGIQASLFFRRKYLNAALIFITSFKDSDIIQEARNAQPQSYLIKPISSCDLEAALMTCNIERKEIIKRKEKKDSVNIGLYTYNIKEQVMYKDNVALKLSKKETLCLHKLCVNKNLYLSHEVLSSYIWNDDEYYTNNSLRELLFRLRKKLPELTIENIPNIGYSLKSLI